MPPRRGPARALTTGLVAAALALLVVGCGEEFTTERAVDSFQNANPDASLTESTCVVDLLVDEFGLGRLESELAAEPPEAGFEEAQFRAMFRCGLEGDIEEQITDQLVATGVDDADAPCVSAELVGALTDDDIDVLLSGEITEEFSAKFLEAMDACGALNP
ncbi:MAG: hypothetical protein AAF962_01165 [Actinomycetota bacterium]